MALSSRVLFRIVFINVDFVMSGKLGDLGEIVFFV